MNDKVKHADVIVVGAGITGLTTALDLHKSGASVVIADAGYPPASSSAAGILSALPPWEYDPRINGLIDEGNRRIFSLLQEVESVSGVSCEWRRIGMLALAHPNSGNSNGIYTPVNSLLPHINTTMQRGLWMPEVSQLRAELLVLNLLLLLKKMGIQFIYGAGKFVCTGDKVSAWQTPDGEQYTADSYVLCAGAHSGELCPAPAPPIVPFRGQLLLYRPLKPLICIVLNEDGLYLSPRHDDAIVVGASFEEAGFDNRPNAVITEELHRRASALFPPLVRAQIINAWSGLRPCLPDGVPVIDKHPRVGNLYLNTGHSRYGISMALASSRHARKLVASGGIANNPFAFRPEWAA